MEGNPIPQEAFEGMNVASSWSNFSVVHIHYEAHFTGRHSADHLLALSLLGFHRKIEVSGQTRYFQLRTRGQLGAWSLELA